MNDNNSRFIIGFLVNNEVSEFHKQLVDQTSERFNLRKINAPSHITLKDSFYCSDTSEVENIILNLQKHDLSGGELILDEISNFRNEIFYINSKPNTKFVEIYLKLLNDLRRISWLQWDKFDTEDREFHLTITNKSNSENYNDIEKYLSQFKPNFIVTFDNITILRKDEADHKWTIHKGFDIS